MSEPTSKTLQMSADEQKLGPQLETLFGPLEENTNEVSILASGPIPSGRAEVHSVRPGLRLFVMDMDLPQDVPVNIHPIGSGILMSLVLDGRSAYAVQRSAGRHDEWEFVSGRNIIGTFKAEASHWNIKGGDRHRFIELQITSGRALQLLSDYSGECDKTLCSFLSERDGFASHVHGSLSPELRMIGHQILNCPMQGSLRRLFMESKALEILAFQLDALVSTKLRDLPRRKKDECDRLEEARRIIEREFVDPPSLLMLAHRVGLNDFKLKCGFRECYQTTVFGYVRMLRMERARIMLEAGESSVSEVALATGYSCFGHFAKAFRQHFGITPRDFKNRR